MTRVLSIGATGSIGRHVVGELLAQNVEVTAMVRNAGRAVQLLPGGVEFVLGDLATGEGLADAVDGVDAIILTHGGEHRNVDYDGVRRLLETLNGRSPRIVLMTSMATSRGSDDYGGLLNWKRGAERLVRAYGAPYTIVRPGWFDLQSPTENAVLFEQGDITPVHVRRGVARSQIARTLVEAVFCPNATWKTFELFAQEGKLQTDFDSLFAELASDRAARLAGGGDTGGAAA
ncbi:MAG: SDR family oxidoreductase [Demequina sp.]|nr:SDR family oxidoreductase [Demequina sp.]